MSLDPTKMKVKLRTALYVTLGSILILSVTSNVSLVLTTQNYCVVALHIPFTNHFFQLPSWTWRVSLLLLPLCVLTTLASWILAGVNGSRRRKLGALPTSTARIVPQQRDRI